MEYKVDDVIRVLPNTDLWEEFKDIVEGFEERLEDVNSWRITRVRENCSDDEYKLRIDNTINDEILGWNMIPNQTALVDEIVVGDIVTFNDVQLLKTYSEHFEVSEDELYAKVIELYSADNIYDYVKIKFPASDSNFSFRTTRFKLYKKPKINESLTLFTTEYPFVKPILDEMYGENYDIQEEECKLSKLKADIILKYPEVTITNKNGESHKILDLYVRITMLRNKIQKYLEGFRGTLTDKEAYVNYNHSHLCTGMYHQFTSFCLGSGTETEFILAECNEEFNEDNFTRLLGMIDSYVEHESLDGGPHICMSNINTRTSEEEYITSRIINEEYQRLKISIKETLPIKYVQGDFYSIFEIDSTSSSLEDIMNKYVTKKSLRNKTNGEIFHNTSVIISIDEYNSKMESDNISIIFKGETVIKKVIKNDEDSVDLSIYEEVANPKVVNGIVKELNKELKQFIA